MQYFLHILIPHTTINQRNGRYSVHKPGREKGNSNVHCAKQKISPATSQLSS
jgi:hypothetical protein